MRLRDIRLQLALTAALAAGTAAACRTQPTTPESPTPEVTTPESPTPPTDPQPEVPVAQEGTAPSDLAAQCQVPMLEGFTPAEPVDFIAVRATSDMRDPKSSDRASLGTACSGATDHKACTATLAKTSPSGSGYGYCGMGCTDIGLVFTRGDTVGLVDSPAEAAAFFGTVDTVAEVMHLVRTHDHEPNCATLTSVAGGGFQLEANKQTSDCPFTNERRLVQVAADGTLTQLKMIERKQSGGCAGRRPEGLISGPARDEDPVAEHLGNLAHLEAAAVIAFERLALDLERVGAPADFVRRAHQAAADEVRHAELMAGSARRRGVEPEPVVASPHDTTRDLLSLAIENAVEGCVRETFGVVDALHRAQAAPTEGLRRLFAEIAADEARHAELSWDIHRWMLGRLALPEREEVLTAMTHAHTELRAELARTDEGAVQRALGAPSRASAVAMAESLAAQPGSGR